MKNENNKLKMRKFSDMIKEKDNEEGIMSVAEKKEKESQSKKLILFNVLDILRKYTDEDHRLSQKQIQERLKNDYEMDVDRKTIKASLMKLEEFGYELEYSEVERPVINKKTGEKEESTIYSDFFLRREFENSELRLLIDSVLFSRHIPASQCSELVGKLEKLSNVYFKSRVKHIAPMPQDRTDSQQLFLTIDAIDEAIALNRKISFKYMEYNTDFSQTAKKSSSGKERIYVASPYQMAAKEGKYFLICNIDWFDDVANYRVDRIRDVCVLEDRAKPFENLKGTNGRRLDLEQYMNEHVFMFGRNTTRAKLRVVKGLISDIVDNFGKESRFIGEDDKYVTVSVRANEESIVMFAKNYAPYVVVMEPENVRMQVVDALKYGLEGYTEK